MTQQYTTEPPEHDHSKPIDRRVIREQYNGGWRTRPITDQERVSRLAVDSAMTINQRNKYLSTSDIYVLPDRWAQYTPEQQAQWTEFRQALRDLPTQAGFPYDITWPAHPNGTYE